MLGYATFHSTVLWMQILCFVLHFFFKALAAISQINCIVIHIATQKLSKITIKQGRLIVIIKCVLNEEIFMFNLINTSAYTVPSHTKYRRISKEKNDLEAQASDIRNNVQMRRAFKGAYG